MPSFDPPTDVTVPEQYGVRALVADANYLYTATLWDDISLDAGRMKITRVDKATGANAIDFFDPQVPPFQTTGIRLAMAPGFLAVGDLSTVDPPTFADFPRIYLLQAPDTASPQLVLGSLASKSASELYAVTGSFGAAQPGAFWMSPDFIYGPIYYSDAAQSSEFPIGLASVTPTLGRADALAADDLALYLGTGTGELFRCPLPCPVTSSGNLLSMGITVSGEPIVALALDGDHVWALGAGAPGRVYLADRNAAGQSMIYVTDVGDTSTVANDLIVTTPYALAVDQRYVFVTHAGGISYFDKTLATPPVLLLEGVVAGAPRSVAVDATHVYWGTTTANAVDGRVRRALKLY